MIRLKAYGTTGLSLLTAKIRRDDDGAYLDFSDGIFKLAAHVTPFATMSEPDAGIFPGFFQTSPIDTAAWDDGCYSAYIQDSTASATYAPIELRVIDGVDETQTAQVNVSVALKSSGDLDILAWLSSQGRPITDPDSLAVSVYDSAGSLQGSSSDLSADAQGVFYVTLSGLGLASGAAYTVYASIVHAGSITYRALHAFTVYDVD